MRYVMPLLNAMGLSLGVPAAIDIVAGAPTFADYASIVIGWLLFLGYVLMRVAAREQWFTFWHAVTMDMAAALISAGWQMQGVAAVLTLIVGGYFLLGYLAVAAYLYGAKPPDDTS